MLSTAEEFLRTCGQKSVTVLDLPTAYWHLLAGELHAGRALMPECVRLVVIGGEKAHAGQVRRWHETVGRQVRLINTYGPTEATVVATACSYPRRGRRRAEGGGAHRSRRQQRHYLPARQATAAGAHGRRRRTIYRRCGSGPRVLEQAGPDRRAVPPNPFAPAAGEDVSHGHGCGTCPTARSSMWAGPIRK